MTRSKKFVFVDGKEFSSQSYRVQILIRLNKGGYCEPFIKNNRKIPQKTSYVLEVPMYQNFISTLRTYIFQNLTYNTWKKDNSSDCYQLIIHRFVQQVHKSRYIPGVRQRNCEKAAKFRASCIRILRYLKVIFEVTKAKNIGEANEFWLSEYELQIKV